MGIMGSLELVKAKVGEHKDPTFSLGLAPLLSEAQLPMVVQVL
jgi:hypothetical protein